jgi:glutamate-5-semialdehyde dehydrogenase
MTMPDGTSPAARRPAPAAAVPSPDERMADSAVERAGRAARAAAGDLAGAPEDRLDGALRAMAARLGERAAQVTAANDEDVAAARAGGLPRAFVDRLQLGADRLRAMSGQLLALADAPGEPGRCTVRELPGELVLQEWRRPVGVIGASFEARPNVVIDVASQLIKSRNAGVLRTGSSALRSASVLIDEVVGPALRDSGISPGAIQLLRVPGHTTAYALVRHPDLLPLVILRGSGDTTRSLAREGALHGVRILAHADGGAVIYLDESADPALASGLIEASLDRLGVCNRLNLLLVQEAIWPAMLPRIAAVTERLGIVTSLPPHRHALGHEWALDSGHEATITVAPVTGASDAAEVANAETSGLAASVVAEDAAAARRFLEAYRGTGAFWNATPRLLDGFKLLSVPETGINIDAVPGPRGPVTFRDLYLRQYAVLPKAGAAGLATAGRAQPAGHPG